MHGALGKEARLDTGETTVSELRQSLIRRFGALLRSTHQGRGPAEQNPAAASAVFEQRVCRIELTLLWLNRGQIRPWVTDFARQRRIGSHAPAQVRFLLRKARHERRIEESPHSAKTALVRVLESIDGAHGDERVLAAARAELQETAPQLRRNQLIHRQHDVAYGHQLVLRQQALRRTRTSRDENRLSFSWP